MKLALGGDRKKTPDLYEYRHMTKAEVLAIAGYSHQEVIGNDGRVRRVKINGQPKRWKRSPERIEVPVKYGMYEFARWDMDECLRRFVVRMEY